MKYHPHLSHPGYGWIEPISGPDDPLIEDWIAEGIVQYCEQAVAAERKSCANIAHGMAVLEGNCGAHVDMADWIAEAIRARGEK